MFICNTWPSIHLYMHGQDFVCWHCCEVEMQDTFSFAWSMYHKINIITGENINAMGIDNLCKQSMWGINQNNIEITHHAKKNSIDIKEEFMTQTYQW